jgi:hypothetical protein
MKVPFMYADFECLAKKMDTCKADREKSYAVKYKKKT